MKTTNQRKKFKPILVVEKYYRNNELMERILNQYQWQKNIMETMNQRKEF
jgi:hypothetical protein